ncbi:MAG: hypothetical protein GXY06_07115 [Clostridiaceae bacterium]|nr:hypothetical protein [Clostridiaceae bacterium]
MSDKPKRQVPTGPRNSRRDVKTAKGQPVAQSGRPSDRLADRRSDSVSARMRQSKPAHDPIARPSTNQPHPNTAKTKDSRKKNVKSKPPIAMPEEQKNRRLPNKSGSSPNHGTSSHHNKSLSDSQKKGYVSYEHIGHLEKVRKKRTLSAALFLIIVTLLLMVVTASAIIYINDFVAAKPRFAFVSTGSVEHSVGTTALVVREESVFYSQNSGTLVALVTEGSRVAKLQQLAMVIPEGMDITISNLNNIQQQIVEIERELVAKGHAEKAKLIYNEMDSAMLPVINLLRNDSMNGRLADIHSYTSTIQVIMDKRDQSLQNVDFNDEQLIALRNTKTQYERELSSGSTILSAVMPGVVSYKIDGLETVLTYQLLQNMLPSECSKYISESSGIITTDPEISSGDAVLRISQNETQYFACTVSDASVYEYPLDSIHKIRVPAESILIEDCKVVRSTQYEDNVFVVFKTSNSIERLLDRRSIDIEIIKTSTEGLRVPVSALVDPDYSKGFADILINSSGYARSLTVILLDYDREYAIIAPVEGFDQPNHSTIVITNPHTIADGEKVEQ